MKKLTMIFVLVLACALVFPVSAQKLGFNGVGVGAGVIMPEDPWDTGFNIAGYANMGELTDNLVFVPGLAYWSAGADQFGNDITLSNFAVNADVHYFFERKQIGPYAGGGIGLNFVSFEFSLPTYTNPFTGQTEGGTQSTSETKFGFQVLGGYMMEVSKMMGFVEAKYNIISDFSTFQINVGVWFNN
jgi:opacity protein-like surface antigen